MTTLKHITFLEDNRDLLAGPVLIIGSKMYEYDQADLREFLDRLAMGPIIGLDLEPGEGVDVVADACHPTEDLLERHRERYRSVLCLETLTHVDDPFAVAQTINAVLMPGGTVFLSECVVRKLTRMPSDNWRFTYSGLKLVFPGFRFHDARGRMALVRSQGGDLLPLSNELPQVLHGRHVDETRTGHLLRRLHRRFLASGVFTVSRLLPETTIMAVATKPNPNP